MNSREADDADGASLMAALFNRRRQWLPLSVDEIKIVDEFAAGRLAGEAAAAAESLVRDNAFAAERVMEWHLLQQAESGPAPPPALTERILKEAERATAPRSPIKRPFVAALLSWKAAGVAVAAVAAMVLGGQLLLTGVGRDAKQANSNPTDTAVPSVQVAMATIANRDLLSESSDMKVGNEPARSAAGNASSRKAPGTSESVAPRFYDIEVPSDVLAGWMARARNGAPIPAAELERLVDGIQTFSSSQNRVVLFDEALQTRLPQPTPPEVPKQTSVVHLRVYDLGQQPGDDLVKAITIRTPQKLAPGYFATLRP
jgi:hypothetical protein